MESIAQDEFAGEPHGGFETEAVPFPCLAMCDAARHQEIGEKELSSGGDCDRGGLPVAAATMGHERLGHHFKPRPGGDLKLLTTRGRAVLHFEDAARAGRRHE